MTSFLSIFLLMIFGVLEESEVLTLLFFVDLFLMIRVLLVVPFIGQSSQI